VNANEEQRQRCRAHEEQVCFSYRCLLRGHDLGEISGILNADTISIPWLDKKLTN
jgi:hypothetical protein